MESLIGNLHANECVNDGLDTVLSNVDQEITQKWLQSMDVPLTVDVVMLKMKKLVAWSMTSHDGDVQAPTAMARGLERRAVEDEPVAVTIDPWARGTVPTKKELLDPFLSLPPGSGPPSVASRQPSRRGSEASGMSGGKSGTMSSKYFASTKSRKGGGDLDPSNLPGTIIELDEEMLDFDASNPLFNQLQKLQRQKLKELKLRESRASVDEFAFLLDEIKKAKGALKKGRDKDKPVKFAIDKDGKLITIEPVRPEGLPPFAVPLEASIGSLDAGDGDGKRNRSRSTSPRRSLRVPGSVAVPREDLYFQAAYTLSSTLSGGEHIKDVQAGVTVQAGEKTRMGPDPVSPPGKVSRKEYLRGGGGGSTVLDSSFLDSPETNPPPGSSVHFAFALEGEMSPSAEKPMPLSRQASMRMPDVDPFEGSRPVVRPEASTASDGVGARPGEDDDDDYGGGVGVDAGGSKSDLSLVANRLPVKPSEGVKANMAMLHGGPAIPGNRDRDLPISMLTPAERTKLPAPPIGRTTGHGLPVSSPLADKSLGGGLGSLSHVDLRRTSFQQGSAGVSPLMEHTIVYSSKGSVGSAISGKREPVNQGVIKTENKAIVRQMIR